MVPNDRLLELDRWALITTSKLIERCREAYENFDFHIICHSINNFCTIDMSNFYLDIIKDRLYVEKADSVARRSAQTAIYKIIRTITLLLAPVLSFTSEEVWGFIP